MRIISWNIRAGGGRRVAGIAAQLQRWRPDVVALQEFRGTAPSRELARRLADLGLPY
jgi:exonuclease III